MITVGGDRARPPGTVLLCAAMILLWLQGALPLAAQETAEPQPPAVSTAPLPSSAANPPSHAVLPATTPVVIVRAGDHGSFVRLVFEWPAPVGYSVDEQAGHATIAFSKAGKIDLASLQGGLPGDMSATVGTSATRGLAVALQLPPHAHLRPFISGNKIVVDIERESGKEPAVDKSKPPPAAKMEKADRAPAAEAAAASPGKRPSASAMAKSGLSPVKPIPEPKGQSKSAPPAAAPPVTPAVAKPPSPPAPAKTEVAAPAKTEAAIPAKAAAADSVKATSATGVKTFSLSIPMSKPAAAAVFQRAGYWWMIFDRRQEMDTALLRRSGGEAVLAVEQLPNKEATVLRLVVQPDYTPSLRKEGLLWVVDLTNQYAKPKDIIPVVAPAVLASGVGMSLRAPDSGSLITIMDPEVGDQIKVVPVIPANQGVYPGRDTPDIELLASAQGIAIVPHVDGLDIRSTRNGVTIGTVSGAGLRFSSDLDTAPKDAATSSGNSLFDIGSWKNGGPENFESNRKIVADRLSSVSLSKRALANLQAARFYFANGFGGEALGYLRLAAVDQPDLADTPGFLALKGASETLMGQWDLAQATLDNPALQNDPESQMWRAAAHVAAAVDTDSPAQWDKPLAAGLPMIKPYPHRLKWQIATLAVKAAVAAGDDQAASQALTLLDREEADKLEEPERDYLHGAYDQMAGHFEKALDEYDSAADGANREYRALAKFAEIELSLRTHKIAPKEAADQLDKLRFSWREQAFEFNLLFRYADLQREAGDFPSALRALRSLIDYYPDDKDTPKATKLMSDIFNSLYLDGQADSMSPVSAIGLYDEFHDLTPTGPEGDEMIRKLADRLAKVDLLDRAADLLKHQVTYRLQGQDKTRVGAQLAVLDLMNDQPQAALDGLAVSESDAEPDDLKRQRRHLKARALSDLGHPVEAIQALDGDMSPDAAQLRVEIHWKAQDWPMVAADFEAMLPRPDRGAKFDDSAAKQCLSWATALVLANDERGLANLRRNYAPALVGTPYQEGFNLLTSALDRETPDLPEVIAKIKEVEGFKSFLTDYRKRVQQSGLSGIN